MRGRNLKGFAPDFYSRTPVKGTEIDFERIWGVDRLYSKAPRVTILTLFKATLFAFHGL